jgi:hypothetical protein
MALGAAATSEYDIASASAGHEEDGTAENAESLR